VIRVALVAVAALATAGCALRPATFAPTAWPADLPAAVEITATPFHAQDRYQCGPAALATVLESAGVAVTPEALVAEVYLPARRGSLQTELIAATRRRDRVAYEIEPDFAALLREVAAGRPVLVLQNLAIDAWPRWHYAVVIGYDATADRLVLRSGTTARQLMSRRRFESSWRRAARWGMVVSRPAEPPVTASPLRWLRAAADLDVTQRRDAARAAQHAAIARWPDSALAAVALANGQLADGDAAAAERSLHAAVARGAADAIVYNNLADLRGARGCRSAALQAIGQAERLLGGAESSHSAAGSASAVRASVAATRAALLALPGAAEPAGCDRPP
jgi:predicted double-glycine peptidase